MTAANWKRTLKRLRRNMAELRTYDCQVIEPPNMDIPPERRYAQGGPVAGPGPIVLKPGIGLGPEFIAPANGGNRK